MSDHEPAKKDAGLADGYCRRCDRNDFGRVGGVQYDYDHPEHHDGVSEWVCLTCGRREGRWTGAVLTNGASEPRYGVERDEVIAAENYRCP